MFRSFSLTAAAATLVIINVMTPASAKTVFPIEGGSGDAGFQDYCPANQFVTGLAGRGGLWIDRIQIICAPILPNGMHGPTYYGPARGGTGGAAQEYSCATDSVVTGVNLHFDDEDKRVVSVDLTCASLQASRTATVDFGGFEPDSTLHLTHPEACPNGEVASGFAGRYGKDLNALGLLCDARVVASAPAPAPATSLACPQGFVWRVASPADRVCVTPTQRTFTALENAAAASHVSPTDRTYGPNTCISGFVWRQAYSGDAVCVTPQQRADALQQNQVAPAMIPRPV